MFDCLVVEFEVCFEFVGARVKLSNGGVCG